MNSRWLMERLTICSIIQLAHYLPVERHTRTTRLSSLHLLKSVISFLLTGARTVLRKSSLNEKSTQLLLCIWKAEFADFIEFDRIPEKVCQGRM